MSPSKAGKSDDLDQVIARRIRELRDECQMTQADLASGMQELGFAWSRVTVAEVESSKRRRRRVAIDEWIGLGRVFGVEAIRLLETPKGTKITVSPELQGLSVLEVLKLIAGAEALDEWYRQIRAEHVVMGAGEAFQQAVDELTKPIEAARRVADVLEQRLERLRRAARIGDLALVLPTKEGDDA